ncbi:MAG: aldo/keto reductase [Bacteroidetes bacterium]|nr:aldo/keto reductase [Bacteroidota bacterium]
MEYRRLGKSGLQVSALSFGSWVTFGFQVDNKVAEDCIKLAYDSGINFFDNAEVYASGQSELVMGNILKEFGWSRDTFVVSSKVFWGGKLPNQRGLSRKHVIEACHAALRRLQVDYLDLYYCHRPDHITPVEETVRAMTELIHQGKVLYWGTSEWSAQQIQEAYGIARQYNLIPPTMEQPQYNMFHRERVEVEYNRLYDGIGLGTTIWSPLASGLLTGKYNDGIPEGTRINLPNMDWLKEKFTSAEAKEQINKVKKLADVAKSLNTTLPCLAIAWCLKNPKVSSVILGASKVSQLEENLQSLEVKEQLTAPVMEELEAILQNKKEVLTFL